jgi:hypothetical protein
MRLFFHDQGRLLWDPMWLPAVAALPLPESGIAPSQGDGSRLSTAE